MECMGQIARLATFATAFLLVVLAFFLPWFRIEQWGVDVELNALPLRGTSGLELHMCDDCPAFGTGRLPGGLAWLASYVAFQLAIALVVSGVQVLRGHRSAAITMWTTLSAVALALLVLGIIYTFDGSSRAGAWLMFLACPASIIGHTRLFDRFDPPPLIEAPPPPLPIERLERKSSTIVRAADIGQAGLRITTDDGVTRLTWDDVLRVQLISGLEPGVELTTRGASLRINRKTTVDYRFLPGATDGTAADNLRRLYEFVRERNPALRMTP
jgi:hypothetical protein